MDLAEIFARNIVGSPDFVSEVDSECGFGCSHTEIERIASRAATATEFERIWRDESWWADAENQTPETPAPTAHAFNRAVIYRGGSVTVENARVRVTVTRAVWDSYEARARAIGGDTGREREQRGLVLSDALPNLTRAAERLRDRKLALLETLGDVQRAVAGVGRVTTEIEQTFTRSDRAFVLQSAGFALGEVAKIAAFYEAARDVFSAIDPALDGWQIEVTGILPEFIGVSPFYPLSARQLIGTVW